MRMYVSGQETQREPVHFESLNTRIDTISPPPRETRHRDKALVRKEQFHFFAVGASDPSNEQTLQHVLFSFLLSRKLKNARSTKNNASDTMRRGSQKRGSKYRPPAESSIS